MNNVLEFIKNMFIPSFDVLGVLKKRALLKNEIARIDLEMAETKKTIDNLKGELEQISLGEKQ